jgi:hypothetical protein
VFNYPIEAAAKMASVAVNSKLLIVSLELGTIQLLNIATSLRGGYAQKFSPWHSGPPLGAAGSV